MIITTLGLKLINTIQESYGLWKHDLVILINIWHLKKMAGPRLPAASCKAMFFPKTKIMVADVCSEIIV